MKRKGKIILTLGCAALGCLVLGACRQQTPIDELENGGNVVSVTYHPNGGKFMETSGITIVDMFNPDKFTDTDGDGKIEISLKSTDPSIVPQVGAPMKQGYSFAGWFKTREPVTNEAGEPIDDNGNVLELRDNVYYIKGAEKETVSEVAYHYSEKWDFDQDKVVYEQGSGTYSLTLYAAWVPYFTYNFYYEDEKTGEWTLLNSQSFDYTTTQRFHDSNYGYAPALKTVTNNDYIWVPHWSGENDTGAMEHSFKRTDNSSFNFPSLAKHTFRSAYTDEACTEKITNELQHEGTLTYEKESGKLVWNNRTQNIYVKFDKGEQYRITTAQEFVTYGARANDSSVYTILSSELDFTDLTWPSALTSGEFAGKIVGNNSTFKNISAENGDTGVTFGGLFGTISAEASVKDITFENVVYDMDIGTTKTGFNVVGYYGVFAGIIEAGADVSGITIVNPALTIGKLELQEYQANLVCGNANGNKGITYSGAKIILTSWKDRQGRNLYFVTVNGVNEETGAIDLFITLRSSEAVVRDSETFVAYPAENN